MSKKAVWDKGLIETKDILVDDYDSQTVIQNVKSDTAVDEGQIRRLS